MFGPAADFAGDAVPGRQSDDARVWFARPAFESNDDPLVEVVPQDAPDPIRYGDTPGTRLARRGYIAWFLAPTIWQRDRFVGGKVEMNRVRVATFPGGMAPDSAQRANITPAQATSWGDLVTASTTALGIDPWVGF